MEIINREIQLIDIQLTMLTEKDFKRKKIAFGSPEKD